MNITDYLSCDYKPIDSQETIENVKDFFIDLNFSHFPIVEEGIYIGSIAADDIETFDDDKKVIDYKYTLEPFFTRSNAIWLEVLEVFAKNHSNLVPVLNEENKYIGYYEVDAIMSLFYQTPFLKETGKIIKIKKGIIDYSMSQITQIVESNNGKLLGMFISEAENDMLEITIKISMGTINEIVQTFRRYGYEITSEHIEDNYINNLKERSDYLNKYLNM